MSIPRFYKFVVVNNSGVTITFNDNGRYNLKITGIFTDPDTGKVTYANLGDDDLGFEAGGSTVDGGEDLSTEIDNTTNLYTGLQVQLEVTHDLGGTADGTFGVFLAGGDATGELPTDASGYGSAEAADLRFIGSLTWDPNGIDDEVMRSNVWEI